jgi:hypothetical protein
MNASILTMLAAPYVLFAGIAGLIYRAVRRGRRDQAAAGAAETADPRPEPPGDPPPTD